MCLRLLIRVARMRKGATMNEGLAIMASHCQIDVDVVEQTLRKTAFASCRSNEEFYAMVSVANAYNLNPFLKEIYAFPSRGGGVVPIVGVDGWLKMVNAHPAFDGLEVLMSEDGRECVCSIWRKDRSKPVCCTEYLAECAVTGSGPWKSHPRRMLRHKAIIQCARIAFGFSGIYDEDEGVSVAESGSAGLRDVSPKKPLFGAATHEALPQGGAEAVLSVDAGGALSDVGDDVASKESVVGNINQSIAELGADVARVLAYACKQADGEYASFMDMPMVMLRQLDAALIAKVKAKYGDK